MKTDWHNLHSKVQEKRKKVTFNTMQIIAFGFLGVIFLGSILLYLPISNQEPIAYLDALFVSASAVCVTGLVTVFPAAQFTLFGKVVLLGLIQIGGLGVIACTMAVFLAIRKKITMKSRVMIQQTYNLETLSGMVRFIIRILKGTVLVEGIGAVLFAFHFVPQYGFIKGVAYGIFHSVSAFCNAGIDVLGTSSFMEYVSSPLVSLTTMFLIVAGGLGFTVWHDVRMNLQDVAGQKRPLKRLFTRLHLQSKMVIVMTAGLIMIGTLGYFLLEYHNDATIGKLGFGEKLLASGFQSVTTRTAGFATVSGRTDFGIQVVWMYSDVYRRFSGRYGGRYQDDDNGHLAAHLCCSDPGKKINGVFRKTAYRIQCTFRDCDCISYICNLADRSVRTCCFRA